MCVTQGGHFSVSDSPYLYADQHGMKIDTLDDYLAVVEKLFVVAVAADAVCLKSTQAYQRSLRYEDEFVRHKILDLIGDLALIGHPVVAHAVVHRGGHALHTQLAAALLADRQAWQLVDAPSEVPANVGSIPVPITY